ncbi:MAG: class I SAM-dependent methyltransferase [Dehalococcoidia bacterium]|nr:MAG: class I SAM-dependent methyltransferase [Dehalococcoidia bacterium]
MAGSRVYSSPFDTLASAYDAWFEEKGKLIFAMEVQAFREILPLLAKPWLEVGVGSGRFAQALVIATGIDPSIKLLDMARSRGIHVFLSKGENAPFRDGAFGAIFIIVTLCFVGSPLKVLTEANRLLRRGGKIVLGLVLQESPWGQHYQVKKRKGHRFYKQATFYSYAEVKRLLNQTGFSIEHVLSTLFQKPGDVRRMESPQKGYSPNAGFTVLLAGKSPS